MDTRTQAQQLDHWLARLSDDDVDEVAFQLGRSRGSLDGATGAERLRHLYDMAIRYGQFDALAAAVRAACPRIAWNLPQRNVFFTGRADLLTGLRAALRAGQPTALTQALAAVWSLPQAQAQNQAEATQAALARLAQRGGWLLVYDNAQDPESLRPFLPRPVQGHVVITTRHAHWGRLARALDVPVLPPDEAADLLVERSGDPDRASALELAEALGGLPLALEQAGAYCAARGIGLAGYMARFQDATLQAKLLRLYQPDDYPDVVAGTWALAFATLDPAATPYCSWPPTSTPTRSRSTRWPRPRRMRRSSGPTPSCATR